MGFEATSARRPETEIGMKVTDHESRGWPGEAERLKDLNDAYGSRLETLAEMRDRCIAEIDEAELRWDSLIEYHRVLLLIALAGVTTLDALRVLLEHGYPEHAFGLTRRLYELEVDASLLIDDPSVVDYYVDYETYDLVWNAGEGVELGDVPNDPEYMEQLEVRRTQLADAYERANLEYPPDFETMSLAEAAEDFARKRWRGKRAYSWRPVRGWKDEILPRVISAQLSTLAPDLTSDDDEYVEFRNDREKEHFFFGEMSSHLHVSPRTVASHGLGFRVGDDLQEMGPALSRVAIHFVRIHHLACVNTA